MSQLGADVEALDRLGNECERQSDFITAAITAIAGSMGSTWWMGADAAGVRSDWSSTYQPQMKRIAALLDKIGADAKRQALQQRNASAGVGTAPQATPFNLQGSTTGDDDRSAPPAPDGPQERISDVNMERLHDDLERLRDADPDDLSDEDRRIRENALAVEAYIEEVQSKGIDPHTGKVPVVQLLRYEPAEFNGQGAAAISIGNVDTADNVAFFVPGITSNVKSISPGDALSLYDEASRAAPEDETAIVHWVGYDAPSDGVGFAGTPSKIMAINGALRLSEDFKEITSTRTDDPHFTVIGHSYGSTVTAIASDKYGLDPDELVLIGSPGAGFADNVDDFPVDPDHIFVGANSDDPVADLGTTGWTDPKDVVAKLGPWAPLMLGLGNDPAEDDFGAIRFGAEDANGWGIDSHTSYFDPGSESVYNLADIVTHGELDDVDWGEVDHRHDPLVDVSGGDIEWTIPRGPFGVPIGPPIPTDVDLPDVDTAPQDPEDDRDPYDVTPHPTHPNFDQNPDNDVR